MAIKVTLPQFGESVNEATVTKWLKSVGDEISEFDPLVEVNTDKVDTEVPSPGTGTLISVLVSEGETIKSGTILAWIGKPGEEIPELSPEPMAEALEAEDKKIQPLPESVPAKVSTADEKPSSRGFISPVVARIAQEHSIDLSKVPGTGRGGRITKKDILAYIKAPAKEKLPKPAGTISDRPIAQVDSALVPGTILKHTPVRRAIAEHMVRSKHTSPHVTTVMEADISKIVAHRDMNKAAFAREGVRLTYTAYFIATAVAAAKAFPITNSSWSDDGIILHAQINIGMATSLGEEGLIVPVIKNADRLSLLGIAQQVNDLAERARTKKLDPEEVQGATFTLTNHGISGSLFATPVISQPQCAILGVGAIQKRAVVINDAIAIRPMVYVSLTFDHRILDGANADYVLAEVVKTLENWQ